MVLGPVLKTSESKQTVFKLFSPKSSGIPPSLRYGATFRFPDTP